MVALGGGFIEVLNPVLTGGLIEVLNPVLNGGVMC
jgi:hypothetical protein